MPFDLPVHEVHRRASDEAGYEQVVGVVVKVAGRIDLLEAALANDGDAIAHRHRLDLIVGDVDGRGPEALLEHADLGPHLHPQFGIEVGEGLVHQEGGGLADDGPPHRHALALATGEGLGLALEVLGDLEHPGGLRNPPLDLFLAHLAELQPEGHVVVDAHVGIEGVVLEDHGDVPILRGHIVDHSLTDLEVAFGDLLETRNHPQKGGLAASRRSDQNEELTVGDVEVDIGDRTSASGVNLADLLESYRGH